LSPTFGEFLGIDGDGGGLLGGLGDALTGLAEGLGDMAQGALENLGDRVDDVLTLLAEDLWGIPQKIFEGIMQMFADEKFWQAVLLFLGFIIAAEGLAAAAAAPAGGKWKAFLEGAGTIYNGWHIDFAVKLHRLTYLISPEYREAFLNVLGDLPQKMADAGIDVGYATNLIGSIGALFDSFGAMIGKDWAVTQKEWYENMLKFGNVSAETMQEWGQDPNKMMEWIDENMIAPAYSQSAAFMNSLSAGLATALERTDKFVNDFRSFRGNLSRVASDIDVIYGTDLQNRLEEQLVDIDDLIYIQWELLQTDLNEIRDILDVKIAEGLSAQDVRLDRMAVAQAFNRQGQRNLIKYMAAQNAAKRVKE